MLRRVPALIALLAAPAVLPAQMVGSITLHMSITIPDSMLKAMPSAPTGPMAFDLSAASDGRRVAMDVGLTSGTGILAMFGGAHVRVIYVPGEDTVHAALLMPGIGGTEPSGYKIDLPMSALSGARATFDSAQRHAVDSISRSISAGTFKMPDLTSLHRTDTVAGMSCEVWRAVTAADTTEMCVIPEPEGFHALRDSLMKLMPMADIADQMKQYTEESRRMFGGRTMIPIRMVLPARGMTMELRQASRAKPDPSVFTLPANLVPAPFGIPGMQPHQGGR